ncbi:hypothetical protein DFH08DRAFT_938327 [Mycena albidolilacea]|uniref:Uncharacterized protein n=1 Tax=Mycena albidolilacea TaxID=1033008 RepID=A0AAD6ZVB6_9AGAR|nr:hypothetical protein DFH08DRAFT_938327 [Mycena albidolilacea]
MREKRAGRAFQGIRRRECACGLFLEKQFRISWSRRLVGSRRRTRSALPYYHTPFARVSDAYRDVHWTGDNTRAAVSSVSPPGWTTISACLRAKRLCPQSPPQRTPLRTLPRRPHYTKKGPVPPRIGLALCSPPRPRADRAALHSVDINYPPSTSFTTSTRCVRLHRALPPTIATRAAWGRRTHAALDACSGGAPHRSPGAGQELASTGEWRDSGDGGHARGGDQCGAGNEEWRPHGLSTSLTREKTIKEALATRNGHGARCRCRGRGGRGGDEGGAGGGERQRRMLRVRLRGARVCAGAVSSVWIRTAGWCVRAMAECGLAKVRRGERGALGCVRTYEAQLNEGSEVDVTMGDGVDLKWHMQTSLKGTAGVAEQKQATRVGRRVRSSTLVGSPGTKVGVSGGPKEKIS